MPAPPTSLLKRCPGCRQDKPEEEFAWRSKVKGRRQSRCKPCTRLLYRAAYREKPETYRVRNTAARAVVLELIAVAKDRPCLDCDETYPPFVMDFDHRPGEAKRFNLSRAVRLGYSPQVVAEEIAKCDVVCANCHRIRTFGGRVSVA